MKAFIFTMEQDIAPHVVERWREHYEATCPPWMKPWCFPASKKPFNIGAEINHGVSEGIKFGYDVVIKTDIDCLASRDLLVAAYERCRTPGHGMRAWPRYTDEVNWDHDAVLKMPHRQCDGAWMALHVSDWVRVGGVSEVTREWGGDDTEFFERAAAKGVKIHTAKMYPLLHINHEPRSWRNGDFRAKATANLHRSRAYSGRNWIEEPLTDEESRDILG